MEAGSILSADVLDIIFDARNKEYGAYDLRKNYQRRLVKAVIVTSSFVVLTCVTYVVLGSMKPKKAGFIEVGDMILTKIDTKVDPPVVVPPPVKKEIIDVKTKQFTKFLIAPDNKVDDDVKPPEQDDLTNAKIGTANVDGKEDDNLVGPAIEEKRGVIDAPKKQDEGDGRFIPIEVESEYPGGLPAWSAFLNRNLIFPQDAADNEIQGTVTVQFIVDAEGSVSNITALSGPEELRSAAIAVIKKSGKWTPALQNGSHVKSYKKQPITFKIVQ